MKLFFDEDTGRGVPIALNAVGIKADYVGNKRRFRNGTADEIWLPVAGREGWLVFSCNKAILVAEAQKALFIEERVGAVFLTSGQERKLDLLRLILRKLDWLELIDREEERPFAFEITISGRTRRSPMLPLTLAEMRSASRPSERR